MLFQSTSKYWTPFILIYTPHKGFYFQLQPSVCACEVTSELMKKDYRPTNEPFFIRLPIRI